MEKREEEGKDGSSTKINRLKGMKIRDEFLCPITYELMREPVVAMDGHTYEKSAIEKWLKSNQTSPRSGEPMDTITIPNMNLKKLIQDIINEVMQNTRISYDFLVVSREVQGSILMISVIGIAWSRFVLSEFSSLNVSVLRTRTGISNLFK